MNNLLGNFEILRLAIAKARTQWESIKKNSQENPAVDQRDEVHIFDVMFREAFWLFDLFSLNFQHNLTRLRRTACIPSLN